MNLNIKETFQEKNPQSTVLIATKVRNLPTSVLYFCFTFPVILFMSFHSERICNAHSFLYELSVRIISESFVILNFNLRNTFLHIHNCNARNIAFFPCNFKIGRRLRFNRAPSSSGSSRIH